MGRQLAFPLRAESIWDWIGNIYKEETKKKKRRRRIASITRSTKRRKKEIER